MDLASCQRELQKRTAEAATPWGRKQNDHWDGLTRFIYATPTWDGLKRAAAQACPAETDSALFFAYAANRWFNFWSAKGVEAIFCRHSAVKPASNPLDRRVDFFIQNIPFDHKTSVFPQNFPHSLADACRSPVVLVDWFYRHQSGEGRQHFHNRLFVVLYNSQTAEHWKLRAELLWLKEKIDAYVQNFNPQKLVQLRFDDRIVFSDIVWAIR